MTGLAPALGPNPRVASAIAYSAWWASGAVIWLVERDRPDVRFHGMQSLVAFGTVFLAWLTCWLGSFATLIVSANGFFVLQRAAQGILIGGFVVWAVCLVQVLRGAPIHLPLFGGVAARLDARLTSLRSNPQARG
jgi:uncharacterized membrane protein